MSTATLKRTTFETSRPLGFVSESELRLEAAVHLHEGH
jgi:hypothetical protein